MTSPAPGTPEQARPQGLFPVRQVAARLRAAHPPLGPEGLDRAGPHRGAKPPHRHRPARRDGACRDPPPRPRHARAYPRGRQSRRRHPAGKDDSDLPGVRRRVSAALRAALEALGAQDRAHLPERPHPARVRQNAPRPHRPGGRGRVVRRGKQGQARRGQPRLRDTARDDVPGQGMGTARARFQPLPRHRRSSPGSSTRTSWVGSSARSTPARRNGPRPSRRSGC